MRNYKYVQLLLGGNYTYYLIFKLLYYLIKYIINTFKHIISINILLYNNKFSENEQYI